MSTLMRSFAVVVGLMAGAGCGGPTMSVRMRMTGQPPPAVSPDHATVVFVMPSSRVIASAILDETGHAVGEVPAGGLILTSVTPGAHRFYQNLYKDAGAGNFALWGHELCNEVSGNFEAGKIYFAEVSVFHLFAVHAADPRLTNWAALPVAELDPSQAAGATVSADPEWNKCVTEAANDAAEARKKNDRRAIFEAADGFPSWPR